MNMKMLLLVITLVPVISNAQSWEEINDQSRKHRNVSTNLEELHAGLIVNNDRIINAEFNRLVMNNAFQLLMLAFHRQDVELKDLPKGYLENVVIVMGSLNRARTTTNERMAFVKSPALAQEMGKYRDIIDASLKSLKPSVRAAIIAGIIDLPSPTNNHGSKEDN